MLNEKENKTINTLVELFLLSYINPSVNQFSNMVLFCLHFAKYFGKNEEQMKKLDAIYFTPITYFKDRPEMINYYVKKKNIKRIEFNECLTTLDFIYYRETNHNVSLNKSFYGSSLKRQKSLKLKDILFIFSLVKKEVLNIFIEVAIKNKVALDFSKLNAVSFSDINKMLGEEQ